MDQESCGEEHCDAQQHRDRQQHADTDSRHYGAVAKGHQFRLMAQIRYDFLILK